MEPGSFRFKQFTVHHDQCAMKVGTDGVLLGAMINAGSASRILDIGTGSGLIALMLAQKSNAIIDAVEIHELSAIQAAENFASSPWSHRLNLTHSSFRAYFEKTNTKYDIIVSNPPYFNNSLKSPFPNKRIAKHNFNLSPEEIISGVKMLITDKGEFYVIMPVAETKIIRQIAQRELLFLKSELLISPNPSSPTNRVVSCFTRTRCIPLTEELCLRDENCALSRKYMELTGDYYL